MVSSLSIGGNIIASGSWDESCEVWNILKKKKLYSIKHGSSINHVQFIPTESYFDLITSSRDQTVKVWKDGKLRQILKHSNYCYGFHFDSQKQMLAVAYSGAHMANSGIVRVADSTHRYLSNLTWYQSDFGIKLKLITSSCAPYVIRMGLIPPIPEKSHKPPKNPQIR